MPSRRAFLSTMAAGIAAAAPRRAGAVGAEAPEIQSPLNGPIGLQLWSLREYLPKDLPGTLAKVRGMGFREVESAGLWGKTLPEFRAALDAAGLRCRSSHMGFERLRDDPAGAFAEARALGASGVVCPWIPHKENNFTRDDAAKAAEAFNRFGKAAHEAGMTFGYHCHGYDSAPAPEGTLLDTIASIADPKLVSFQIDVFHAYHGGADPAQLIAKHGRRVTSLHLKDLKKGAPVKVGAATGEPEVDVPVGSGQIDFPAVLRAAKEAGVSLYYVEDESKDPLAHIPQSLVFLRTVKL